MACSSELVNDDSGNPGGVCGDDGVPGSALVADPPLTGDNCSSGKVESL